MIAQMRCPSFRLRQRATMTRTMSQRCALRIVVVTQKWLPLSSEPEIESKRNKRENEKSNCIVLHFSWTFLILGCIEAGRLSNTANQKALHPFLGKITVSHLGPRLSRIHTRILKQNVSATGMRNHPLCEIVHPLVDYHPQSIFIVVLRHLFKPRHQNTCDTTREQKAKKKKKKNKKKTKENKKNQANAPVTRTCPRVYSLKLFSSATAK